MTITLRNRAEVALRFLSPDEQKAVSRALERLQTGDMRQSVARKRLRRLVGSGDGLYAFSASSRLRVILSPEGSGYVVEDIVRPDRLGHLLGKGNES